MGTKKGEWVINPEWKKASHRLFIGSFKEIKVGPSPKKLKPINKKYGN